MIIGIATQRSQRLKGLIIILSINHQPEINMAEPLVIKSNIPRKHL